MCCSTLTRWAYNSVVSFFSAESSNKSFEERRSLISVSEFGSKVIDWPNLKNNYSLWRSTLYNETVSTLKKMAAEKTDIVALNALGVFHKISISGEEMRNEYLANPTIPHRWIMKGNFPGIWCALYHPDNTFSRVQTSELIRIQITFKADFQIFDPGSEEHMKMWKVWKSISSNSNKPNPWAEDINYCSQSMEKRMGLNCDGIDHLAFFKENHFGAFIGYSDYIALVIVDEAAIGKVEFIHS